MAGEIEKQLRIRAAIDTQKAIAAVNELRQDLEGLGKIPVELPKLQAPTIPPIKPPTIPPINAPTIPAPVQSGGGTLPDLPPAPSPSEYTQLAQALNNTYSAARELADGLGLTASESQKATRLLQDLRSTGATLDQQFEALNQELGLNRQQFDKLAIAAKQFKDQGKGVSSILSGFVAGATTAGLQLLQQAIGGVTSSITGFVSESIDAGARLTNIQNTLQVATGSAESGAEAYDFLRQTVDDLSLPLEASARGFAALAANAKGTQLEGEGVETIFRGISTAASGLNLSAEQVDGAILALGQSIGKGRVQSEELRGQLSERIPGAFGIFARALGVTTAELDGLLQRGEVGIDSLVLFAEELERTFGSNLQSPTKSINRLNTAIFDIQSSLGQSIAPAFTAGLDTLSDTLGEATEQSQAFDILSAGAERFQQTLEENPEIAEQLGSALAEISELIAVQLVDGLDSITNALRENPDLVKDLAEQIKGVAVAINGIVSGVLTFSNLLGDSIERTKQFVPLAQIIQAGLKGLANVPGVPDEVEQSVSGLNEAIGGLAQRSRSVGSQLGRSIGTGADGVQQRVEQVAGSADAYKSQLGELGIAEQEAQTAIQEAIANGTLSQDEARQQQLADEQRFTQQRIELARARNLELQDALAGASPEEAEKIQSEILKNDQELASLRGELAKAAADARIEAEREALEKVNEAQQEALDAAQAAETDAQINIQRLLNSGAINQQEADRLRLDSTVQRIQAELAAEEQRIAALEALPQSEESEEQIRAAKRQTSDLTLQLLEAEADRQEQVRQAAIEALEEQARLAENASTVAIQGLERQEVAINAITSSIARQADLLSARDNLQQSFNDYIDAEYQTAIALTEDEERKKQIQEEAAAARLDGVERAQEIERTLFELQQLQNRALLEQERIRNRIAQAQAQADIARAQAELEQLQADPTATQGQVQAAQLGVNAAVQQLGALQVEERGIDRQADIQDQISELERDTLVNRQATEFNAALDNFISNIADDGEREARQRVRRNGALGNAREAIGNASDPSSITGGFDAGDLRDLGSELASNLQQGFTQLPQFQPSTLPAVPPKPQVLPIQQIQPLNLMQLVPALTAALPPAIAPFGGQQQQQQQPDRPPSVVKQEISQTVNNTFTPGQVQGVEEIVADQLNAAFDAAAAAIEASGRRF